MLTLYSVSPSMNGNHNILANVLDVGFCFFTDHVQRPPHIHQDFTEFVFLLSGIGTVTCGDTTHKVSTGDLVIYMPGVQHAESWVTDSDPQILLYVQTNILSPSFYETAYPIFRQSPVLHTGLYQSLFYRLIWILHREWKEKQPNYINICNHILTNLIHLIYRISALELSPYTREPSSLAEQVRSEIDRQPEEIDLKKLSERFHVSIYHLSHAFKEKFGIFPIHYANQQHIEQSKMVLRTTSYSVTKIAFQMGFTNVSNFNHMFRDYTDMTPLQYRKSALAFKERPSPEEE